MTDPGHRSLKYTLNLTPRDLVAKDSLRYFPITTSRGRTVQMRHGLVGWCAMADGESSHMRLVASALRCDMRHKLPHPLPASSNFPAKAFQSLSRSDGTDEALQLRTLDANAETRPWMYSQYRESSIGSLNDLRQTSYYIITYMKVKPSREISCFVGG